MIRLSGLRQLSGFGLAANVAAGVLGLASTAQAQASVTVLHDFAGGATDGAHPYAGLVEASDGMLFGTTYSGGAGSGYAVLHDFTGSPTDGAHPNGTLLRASDGRLYGTTAVGGVFSNGGTVFRMALDGGAYQHLHSFFGVGDGFNPAAGLIEAFDGTLFGTTVYGGEGFRGTIFQLAPDGTGYAVLYSFTGGSTDGANPYPGLIQDQDGVLYGTTFAGGAINFGVVFQLTIGQ